MSVQKLKAKVVQLERKRNKIRLAASRLNEAHGQLKLVNKAMDLLVQHQQAVANMLYQYFRNEADSPCFPTLDDDTGLIQPALFAWPLMAEFQAMVLSDYNWLLLSSAYQVRIRILDALQQLALMVNYHKAAPEQSQELLDKALAEVLCLTKAMYILTPQIVYQLNNVNLLTGNVEPPSSAHWEQAFLAAEPEEEQLQVMHAILQLVVPKMEQLEVERQQLAGMIHSMKAFSIQEQAKLHLEHSKRLEAEQAQQEQQSHQHQQQEQNGNIGSKQPQEIQRPLTRQRAAAAAEAAAPAVGPYSALLQDAVSAGDDSTACGTSGKTSGHSKTSANESSSTLIPFAPQMCKDMVRELDSKLLQWRTLSGARSAVSFVFRSEQLAAILLAAFPYLPMTACLCDYVGAAQARIEARKQQQQAAAQGGSTY